MVKLSDRVIRDLQPAGKDRWIAAGVTGLYLRVRHPGGSKRFVLRKQIKGRNLVESLGEWGPDYLLADAQREAHQRRGEMRPSGKDTVADLADRYYKARIAARYKRPEKVKHYFDNDIADIGDRELRKVTRAQLALVLERKARDGGPVAANRLLGIFRSMFAYGAEVGMLETNPAAGLSRDAAGGKERTRERTLTDGEIAALWAIDSATCDHADLYRFLLLSGQRIGEAQATLWPHVDAKARRWHINDNKSSRPHVCPISGPMLELLERRDRNRPGPFATASTTAAQAWLKRYCARENIDPAFTPHDLRRTCATRVRKLASFDVVERHLNHAIEGVAGTYQRDDLWDERVAAVEAWGAKVLELAKADSN